MGLGGGSELPSAAGITLQQAHDGRVALGASDELLQRELACGSGDTAQTGGHHPSWVLTQEQRPPGTHHRHPPTHPR